MFTDREEARDYLKSKWYWFTFRQENYSYRFPWWSTPVKYKQQVSNEYIKSIIIDYANQTRKKNLQAIKYDDFSF